MGIENLSLGDYLDAFHSHANQTQTAAGSGDNTEVTGAAIDIKPANVLQEYESAVLYIAYTANVASSQTLSFRVRTQTADTSGGTYGDVTEVRALSAAVNGAFNSSGVLAVPINPRTLTKRWLQVLVTADLSAGGTDTSSYRAILVCYKGSV